MHVDEEFHLTVECEMGACYREVSVVCKFRQGTGPLRGPGHHNSAMCFLFQTINSLSGLFYFYQVPKRREHLEVWRFCYTF